MSIRATWEDYGALSAKLNRQLGRSFYLSEWAFNGDTLTVRFDPCIPLAHLLGAVPPPPHSPWWRRWLAGVREWFMGRE